MPFNDGTRDVTQLILDHLENRTSFVTNAEFPEIPQNEIKAALDRLSSRSMIQYTTQDTEQVTLTAEGQQIVEQGSHEWKVWDTVRRLQRIEIKDLQVRVPTESNGSLQSSTDC